MSDETLVFYELCDHYAPDRELKTLGFEGRLVLEKRSMTLGEAVGVSIAQLFASMAQGIDRLLANLTEKADQSAAVARLTAKFKNLMEIVSLPESFFIDLQSLERELRLETEAEERSMDLLSEFFQVHILVLKHEKGGISGLVSISPDCVSTLCLEQFDEYYGVLVSEAWESMNPETLRNRLRTTPYNVIEKDQGKAFTGSRENLKERLYELNVQIVATLVPMLPQGLQGSDSLLMMMEEAGRLSNALGRKSDCYTQLTQMPFTTK